jgi:hypothetical protein
LKGYGGRGISVLQDQFMVYGRSSHGSFYDCLFSKMLILNVNVFSAQVLFLNLLL